MGREKWHGILGKSLLPSQEFLTVAPQKEASSAGKHSRMNVVRGSLTFYKTRMKWGSEAPEMTFPCSILSLTHPLNFSWPCKCYMTSFAAAVERGSQSLPGSHGLNPEDALNTTFSLWILRDIERAAVESSIKTHQRWISRQLKAEDQQF